MSAWRTIETDSIKSAVEGAGGTFAVKDAQGDIATQASDVADLIALGVDDLVEWSARRSDRDYAG